MAAPRIEIDPELLERARILYESGTSFSALGRMLGVSASTAAARAEQYRWTRVRLPGPPREQWRPVPPDPQPLPEVTPQDAEPAALVERLGRMVAREMIRVETGTAGPADVSRTLASLAQTLKILIAIRGPAARQAAAAQDEVIDVDEFKRDLARRLEALCEEDPD